MEAQQIWGFLESSQLSASSSASPLLADLPLSGGIPISWELVLIVCFGVARGRVSMLRIQMLQSQTTGKTEDTGLLASPGLRWGRTPATRDEVGPGEIDRRCRKLVRALWLPRSKTRPLRHLLLF
mmetsp:Transcript_52996/g.95406  ORF Transcript_52996/g.95406 Transcript_52996/m.95406 type:complete len:125 (+) Transcript_52996:247-621(+)